MAGAPPESDGGSNASPLEIIVDPTACRAAGECVFRAPSTFALGEDDKAHGIRNNSETSSVILAAACSCPNCAISVRRDGRELA